MRQLNMTNMDSEPSLVKPDDWLQDADVRKEGVAFDIVSTYVDLEADFTSNASRG